MRTPLCLAIALLLLCPAGESTAQNVSRVKLVSGGKTFNLKFVSATRYVPREGQSEIRLLFTASSAEGVRLADEFRSDEFSVPRWSRHNGTAAVLVTFEERRAETSVLRFYFPEGYMLDGRVTRSGKAGRGAFRKLEMKGENIAGEFSHKSGSGALSGTFAAKLPTVSQALVIRGAEVAASDQGEVLLAFAKHMRKMDLKNAQRYAAGDVAANIEGMRKNYGDPAVRTLLRDRFGDLKQFERDLKSPETTLLVAADRAEIRMSATKKGSPESPETFRFIRADGSWKIEVEP